MKLSWRRAQRRLKYPFQTSQHRRDHQETILVSFEHAGIIGLGEACPMRIYGHTLDTIEATLPQIAMRLNSRNPMHIDHILDDLLAEFDAQRSAVASIDMALHDWIGKRLNVPLVEWFGLDPDRVPATDITIGIDEPAAITAKVRDASAFSTFKVKVGVPNEVDILRAIRRDAPQKTIRVDANMGWSAANAEARLRAVAEFGIELVEQPVAADDLTTLRRMRDLHIVPIVADESCVRPADVPRLAGVVDGINIKLNKCGGIREARTMIRMARALGLKVMLGCTSESSVGVAAAAQLGPLADWIDLDAHLLVVDDGFTGLGGNGGRLTIGRGPGLGVIAKS